MDRPLADKRPFGPFAQTGRFADTRTDTGKPVLRVVTEEQPDKSDIASVLDDTGLPHTQRSKIFRDIEITERDRGGYDVTMPIGGLSYSHMLNLETVVESIGQKRETFVECV